MKGTAEIVPDSTYPGMYRMRLPSGALSEMANLTRVKDALGGGPAISTPSAQNTLPRGYVRAVNTPRRAVR
jgi:hypothetical protein